MVTKEQAMSGGYFHYTGDHVCIRTVGPRGRVTVEITVVKASGRCQTWKTRPQEFRLPVKYGMYTSDAITHHNAGDWHTEAECPLNEPEPMM